MFYFTCDRSLSEQHAAAAAAAAAAAVT